MRPGDTEGWAALHPAVQDYDRARHRRAHDIQREVREEDVRDLQNL